MSATGRLIFSIVGFGLCVTLALSRGDRLREDIVAMELSVFGGLFFLWWGWKAIKELRSAKE